MLAAGLLAQALRAAGRRDLGGRALAVGAAAWRLLQPNDGCWAPAAHSSHSSSCSHAAAANPSSLRSSFSSSALESSVEGSGSGGSGGSTTKHLRPRGAGGRVSHTPEPQPQLQAWLQQEQGLSKAEADQYARRLAHIFGSQQAALDSLPATFEWCRSRGPTGPQTAQLLDRIAYVRRENVVQFATLVQPAWQLLDSHIAAHIEQLRRTGAKLPKHTSLAEALCSSAAAAQALAMPPGHVEAWLAAVSQRLPAAAIGRLLLSHPGVVTGSPSTAEAALDWAADELRVTDPAAFFSGAANLLVRNAPALQRNLDSLQQGLGCTADQARRLAVRQPLILGSSPGTVQAAAAWLRQLFPDAEQLADVINRGPQLLSAPVQRLQGNADTLQQALGWRDGAGQLAAFVATYPQPFANNNLSSDGVGDKLRLLTHVVGISLEHCLSKSGGYLKTGLETMAAHYMLVQGRAPHLLFSRAGQLQLSWVINANKPHYLRRLGLTRPEFNAFVRQWPRSEEGQRLLEGLRAGSVEGWPRPPPWKEA